MKKGRTADVNRLLASKANSKLQNLETYVVPRRVATHVSPLDRRATSLFDVRRYIISRIEIREKR